jgi:hypothetical protein
LNHCKLNPSYQRPYIIVWGSLSASLGELVAASGTHQQLVSAKLMTSQVI